MYKHTWRNHQLVPFRPDPHKPNVILNTHSDQIGSDAQRAQHTHPIVFLPAHFLQSCLHALYDAPNHTRILFSMLAFEDDARVTDDRDMVAPR